MTNVLQYTISDLLFVIARNKTISSNDQSLMTIKKTENKK